MDQPIVATGRTRAFIILIDKGILHFSRHWLAFTNFVGLVFAGLPVLAPYLMSVGWTLPADGIYLAYKLTCHQLPYRSYFVFGYKMAYCQRNFAIYASVLVAGMIFGLVRHRLKPLNWRIYLILITPMAIDGFTQLFGLRESNWELRTITGSLFGAASVWLFFPYLETGMAEVRQTIEQRFARAEIR